MGWLFGKKDDGLYRGDAPVSAPGVDGQPAAYQRDVTVTSRPYEPGSIGPLNAYPTGPPSPYPTGGITQQRALKRTLTRTLLGFLVPVLLVGGLVVVGYVAVDKVRDGIDNPFDIGSAPGRPLEGVVGSPGEVTLGENSYQITIEKATAQPGAAWGSYSAPVSGGFLVIALSITRTDSHDAVSQISWFDWMFTAESGQAQEGELIAGGYEPLLSTLNLASGESAAGLVAFDTAASVGTLSLTTHDGEWARWPITATEPTIVTGTFGAVVHPEAGGAPFSAVLANPRWIGAGDPAIWIEPSSGTYLVLDVGITVDESALTATTSLSVGYDNWQFTPDGGSTVPASYGVNGVSSLTFGPGLPMTASTLIAFDAVASPGRLDLVNADGSVLASWPVPAL